MSVKYLFGSVLGAAALLAAMPGDAQTFPGEILMSGFGSCPPDTRMADGQLLPIQKEKPAAGEDFRDLWLLYGTAYGGDGIKTFALPDLRGQAIAMNDISHGAAKGDDKSAPAMRTALPIVYCVALHGAKTAK